MTVYYKGKLKRTRSPIEAFSKIKTLVKPKGVTKLWKIDESENRLAIVTLEFSVTACVDGIAELFAVERNANFTTTTWDSKMSQVRRLYKEKFLPLFNAESDIYSKCILAYRYMVSVYEYCGFEFVGKRNKSPTL